MALIPYDSTGFNSMVSLSTANSYATDSLYASAFTGAAEATRTAALIEAFRMITQELNLNVDFTDLTDEEQEALEQANIEQAVFLLKKDDPDLPPLTRVSHGVAYTTLRQDAKELPSMKDRFSPRVLRMLHPYMDAEKITVSR